MQLNSALKTISQWHRQRHTVVLATGVFDLLHIEHIRFLSKAKKCGDKLVVGIETDSRVKQVKGHQRPVNSEVIRLEQLNALKSIDLAFVLPHQFSTQTDWVSFMQSMNPTIYAVSSHTSFLKNKQAICDQLGIDLKVVHQFNQNISTTKIFHQLQNQL